MRLDENVGRRDAFREIRPLVLVARVLVVAEIVPGPAIEGALRDVRRVVGRQIVAESVALVDGAPERASSRLDRKARAIANAGRVDALMSAVGIEGEHVGAALFIAERGAERRFGDAGLIRARRALGDIAAGADRDEQRLVVRRKGEIATSSVRRRPEGSRSSQPDPRLSYLRCDRESA